MKTSERKGFWIAVRKEKDGDPEDRCVKEKKQKEEEGPGGERKGEAPCPTTSIGGTGKYRIREIHAS